MIEQTTIFDAIQSAELKTLGMAQAADRKASLLRHAREIAVSIARVKGTVCADGVYRKLIEGGISELALGNSAGSLFTDGRFEWTGRFNKSTRTIGHGNLQRIWKLK